MPILRVEITDTQSEALNVLKKKLKKSKTTITREALDNYIDKEKRKNIKLFLLDSKNKQTKLDLE